MFRVSRLSYGARKVLHQAAKKTKPNPTTSSITPLPNLPTPKDDDRELKTSGSFFQPTTFLGHVVLFMAGTFGVVLGFRLVHMFLGPRRVRAIHVDEQGNRIPPPVGFR
eukprot:Platyproteum_vivax@DN2657_c0_g1_i1.p1